MGKGQFLIKTKGKIDFLYKDYKIGLIFFICTEENICILHVSNENHACKIYFHNFSYLKL